MIERHVAERRAIPLGEALSIFRMILLGVGAAHAEGLIHRDLKPANVLIRKKDGVAKVTDFGIAKGEEDAKAGRGVTRGIIGSLSYMAPEQVRGQRDLDKRVDVYALGILLYELLMGRVPFEAASDYELMRMHAETPVPSITERRPDIPRAIDDMVQRACAKDREARFAGTDDFLSALDVADPASAGAPSCVAPARGKDRSAGAATEIASAPMPYEVVPPPPPEVRLESVRVPKPSALPFEPVRANTTTGGASLPPSRALSFGHGGRAARDVHWARRRGGGWRGGALLLLDNREEVVARNRRARARPRRRSMLEFAKRLPRSPKHARPSRRSQRWSVIGAARASATLRRFSRATNSSFGSCPIAAPTPGLRRGGRALCADVSPRRAPRTSSPSRTIYAPRRRQGSTTTMAHAPRASPHSIA